MPPQSPFSSFAPEDQVDIQDQLTAAYNSGHLNPVQRVSVGNAIRHLASTRVPGPSLPSPDLLQRLTPGMQEPGDTTHYDAVPGSGSDAAQQVRLGQMVPQGAVPALETAKKYAVDPLNAAAQVGATGARNAFRSDVLGASEQLVHPEIQDSEQGAQLAEQRHPLISGAGEAAASLVGGTLTDPRQWPLMFTGAGAVRPLFAKLVSSGFAAQMSTDALHSFADLNNNWDKYSPAERAEKATSLGLTGLFAAGASAHALSSHPTPEVTPSEAPQSVTPEATPQSVTPPQSPKQSIEPEYVGDTVSPSSSPAAPADLAPQRLASDLARPTTPSQPEIAPVETPQKPTENTAQPTRQFTETIDGLQPVPTLQDIASGWRQTAQRGPSPDRQILADMALNPAEDTGAKVRQQMPAMPRGERRSAPRSPDEVQTQQLFGQARKELGEDASSDQIMARVEELKRPSVTPEPLPMAPTEPAAAPAPQRFQASLIPNGSGESAASVEAINRLASEKSQGLSRVAVDTRSGAERPLIGSDAVDYQPKAFESVEFRGGNRDGEVIDRGAKARPYKRSTALASPAPTAMAKAEAPPELDSARISRNLDEVHRLLQGDDAVKRVRAVRSQLPAEATELKTQIKGLQRHINGLRDAGREDEAAPLRDKVKELRDRGRQLVKAYRETGERLGDTPSKRYTDVIFDPERNGNLSAEGKAKASETIRAKVEAAHNQIRQELSFQTDPKRRAQLENWLQRDVMEVTGKGIRATATAVSNKNGAEIHIPTPEITLKTVRELRKVVGDGKPVRSFLDLVPEAERDEIRQLKEVDPGAARQAVLDAARKHVEGIRDNLAQQLEAAKSREAAEAGRPFKPSTHTRNILRDLKAGKRTIADLQDNEIDHLLDNEGVVKQELGPTERMAKKGQNGQGTVLQKNTLAEKFLDRLQNEKADRQKAAIEGEISPHEAMDFAQTLRDHVASKQPLSEEGHNVLAELGIDSKKPAGKVVADLDNLMRKRAANEAGFATPGFLFDLRKLPGDAWRRWVSDPLLRRIGQGAKYQAIREVSPELADMFKKRDNIGHAAREESKQNVKNILGGASHDKERLAALVADADSRENLQTNHPAEYQQAVSDPEVQGIVQRYQKYGQELTTERANAGFATLNDDKGYLRRVYDEHMSGSTGNQPYEKAVSLQDLPKQARKASAEWHYQNGTHEFGPAYGTKYIAQKITMMDRDIVKTMSRDGTVHPKDQPLPNEIQFNGKTYYSPEQAKIAGSHNVYGVYDPLKTTKFKVGDNVILAPKDVVDVASATDRGNNYKPNWFKQGFQKGVIGLSFGIPHAFANVPRRIMNSFEAGMANPRAWAASFKVLFGKELRARSERGVDDPTLRELVRRGAARFDTENTDMGSKWQGLKVGHELIYKPGALGGMGGVDIRARMEYADRLINQNPHMGWDKVSEMVENQFGKYTKENWTKAQHGMAHVVAFPGWLYSSIRSGLEHPLRATVPAAVTVYAINQALYRKGMNRVEDKDDISRIHIGNYSLSPTVFSEPIAKAVAGPALAAAQSLIRGGSNREIGDQFMQNAPRAGGKALYAIVPYYAAPMELAFNRQYAGGEKEIFRPGAFDRKGKTGLSEGTEAILAHLGTRVIPQLGRITPEGESEVDVPGFLGSQVGLPMFKQDAEARLLRNLGETGQASHLVDDYKEQRPTELAQLFQNEPALPIDNSFHSQFEKIQKAIRTIDNEMVAFPDKKADLDAARTVLLSAADEVNDAYQKVRDQQINDKKDKPVDKLKRSVGL